MVNFSNFYVGLIKDKAEYPYYPKFASFLKRNKIPYDYLDIHSENWINNAKEFNTIIWRPMSNPWFLEEAREKVYFLEKALNKLTYPSFDEIYFYENKILQYYTLKNYNFPVADTFISFNYSEVSSWLKKAGYPLVAKIKTGSSSKGTTLLKNEKQARKHVNSVFKKGRQTYWSPVKQKDYVYFQKFIDNKGFDLRIIIIDENNIFGYYRLPAKGDFRASGSGLVIKKDIPKEAVKIALDIIKKLDFTNLAVDFLQSSNDNKFFIIEASNFINLITDEQLKINDTPGKYRYDAVKDCLIFEKGKFWIQELILNRFFMKNNLPTKN